MGLRSNGSFRHPGYQMEPSTSIALLSPYGTYGRPARL